MPLTCPPDAVVIAPTGRVDALSAPALDAQLAALSRPGQTLVVNLEAVSYVSSSGLRVLLLAHRRQSAAGGRLLLSNVPPQVGRILRMAGFDRILSICEEPFSPAPTATIEA
jgi:anti-sigma B factor antagonist